MNSNFTATLGLPTRPAALPTATVPRLKPDALPPAGLLRDAYLVYICTQIAESAASRLVAGVPAFQHTGLHKRVGRLHAGADSVLGTLFGEFDLQAGTILNHLTRTVEAASSALVTLSVAPDTTTDALNQAVEDVSHLATLAGLPFEVSAE